MITSTHMRINNIFQKHLSKVSWPILKDQNSVFARSGPVEEIHNLIGNRRHDVQFYLARRLPFKYLPMFLKNRFTRPSIMPLTFDRLPPKMVPVGFRNQYKRWLIEKTMS